MTYLTPLSLYVQTHIVDILLAILATYGVGFLWHGPLFGKQWMAENKIKPPKKGEASFSMMLPGLSANFVMVFLQATVLGWLFETLRITGMEQAMIVAVILWLPFTALAIVNMYAWSGKTIRHMYLDAGYNLASMLVITAVLVVTM